MLGHVSGQSALSPHVILPTTGMAEGTINNPRTEIDSIDDEILRLLNRRAEVALRVGEVKAEVDAALCDPARETEVIGRLIAQNAGPFGDRGIENIFQRIIDESLYLQQQRFHRKPLNIDPTLVCENVVPIRSRVGYLGDPGSFSETAARAILGSDFKYVSFPTFGELYEAIDMGKADSIISPLENSLVGSIQPCYDFLAKSDLAIVAEIILPVTHFLVAPPSATLETIRSVESHPAALGQCERFFAAHPNIVRIAANDTASAVRRVVESGDVSRAAIGSRRAARLYGGNVLREHIEDHSENFTRFALLSPNGTQQKTGGKISLILRLKNEPGALHDALRPFVRRNIDLSKIESRPISGQPRQFNFYLDLQAPTNEKDLTGAIAEIEAITLNVRVLGRYPTVRITSDEVDQMN